MNTNLLIDLTLKKTSDARNRAQYNLDELSRTIEEIKELEKRTSISFHELLTTVTQFHNDSESDLASADYFRLLEIQKKTKAFIQLVWTQLKQYIESMSLNKNNDVIQLNNELDSKKRIHQEKLAILKRENDNKPWKPYIEIEGYKPLGITLWVFFYSLWPALLAALISVFLPSLETFFNYLIVILWPGIGIITAVFFISREVFWSSKLSSIEKEYKRKVGLEEDRHLKETHDIQLRLADAIKIADIVKQGLSIANKKIDIYKIVK